MNTIQSGTEVGGDGVLLLQVPLGPAEAHSRVKVTIAALPTEGELPSDWPPNYFASVFEALEHNPMDVPPDRPLVPEASP
jgi:hypothetical protein